MRAFIIINAAVLAFATSASADPIPGSGDVERPFGMNWESFDTPINPSSRDANGNRTIVNGHMELEGTLTGGIQDGYASGLGGSVQAIGNQLNVVTQGNYNTVIVNSTQINNGDVSADIDGD